MNCSGQKIKGAIIIMFLTALSVFTATGNTTEPVMLNITSDWGNGFVGDIKLTNTTNTAYNSWIIEFDFPYSIDSIWNAKIKSHTGNHYVIENESWNGAIAPGQTITFGFQGSPGNVTSTISNIKVNGRTIDEPTQNSPPSANNDSITTEQDTEVLINVIENDTDPDNDILTVTSITSPVNGIASIQGTSVKYTPNTGFTGNDTFVYTIDDGNEGADTATVSVNITPVNLPLPEEKGFEYNVSTDWGSGFNGEVALTNTKNYTSSGWIVEFDFPYNITQIWSAKIISHIGNHYIIGNVDWNASIAPNASVSFGFGAAPGNAAIEPSNVKVVFENNSPSSPVANNDTGITEQDKAVTLNVLSNDTGNNLLISSVTLPTHGVAEISENNIVYTPNTDFTGTDTFSYTIIDAIGLTASATITVTVNQPVDIDKRIVGYWQNWYDSEKTDEYIQFRDISPKYNVINVAFAKPKSNTDSTIEFNLDTSGGTTVEEFKSLISQYKSEGKKVLISLGGAVCPSLKLNTEVDKQKFVTSLINIIEEYGFSGLDIDLENSSIGLDPGDNDFRNPTTPSMLNLISAIKEIHDYFGSEFIITAAPETAFVQGGVSGYDGWWGAYLPLLNALRNEIDQIHVQYYNSGSIFGTDGNIYYEGTTDFLVALSEALITGFNVRNSDNEYIFFEGFRPDQVAFGILTSEKEGSGSMHSTEINKALNYIVKGIPFGGQYVLNNSNGYTDFGGIMGWSMTVDKRDYNNEFIDNAYNYFYGNQPLPNSPPIAVDDSIETIVETPVTINVLENDTDADNDILTISSITTPQNGTAEIISSAILYTPSSGFKGIDTFEYTVNDGNNGIDTATVTVSVTNNEPIPTTYTINASVVNNDSGSYPEFVQPMAGDPLYIKGDKVTFADKAYESLIDNNSWSPGNYPAGWKEISQGGGSSGNGTITPSGEIVINEGQSQTFTFIPNSGCSVNNVIVDNVSKGTVSAYTFNNVTANHTISVEFIQTITPDPNSPPTVIFTSPANNQTIKQTNLSPVNISVNAQDSDGTIENITISVDGNEYTENTASWTPSEFDTFNITATAEDNDGATATAVICAIIAKNTPNPDPDTDRKLVIGYFTQWEAWFGTEHGYPEKGVANQLNIDYSKFTNLNYSFFGVANDGSLFSGDFRNKEIYKDAVVQEPRPLLYADYYSSWDYWLLFGELDTMWDVASANSKVGEERFIEINEIPSEIGYSSNHDQLDSKVWLDTKTGIKGVMPIMLPKQNDAKGLIQLCKENNVKLSASIGGWSMCKHFPEVAADPVKRAKFVSDCKKLIDMGFDGIDIDWEYPGTIPGMNFIGSDDDYENFAVLMEEIRETIGNDKLLTAAFSCDPRKLEKYDWSRLQNSMDYFNMMTYDMEGGWSAETGHNSSLYGPADTDYFSGLNYSWNKTFNYLVNVKGIPTEKINMGIASYGRGVITKNNAVLKAETNKSDLWIDPDGLVNSALDVEIWGGTRYRSEEAFLNALLNVQYGAGYYGQPNYFYIKQVTGADNNWNTGWTRGWDDLAKVPYAVKNNSFISYDDEESISYKTNYVMKNDLAGVIIWHVTGDWKVGTVTNTYGNLKKAHVATPLLNVIHNTFNAGNEDPTAEPNYDFPQHINYALPHIQPNNYTQSIMDNDVRSFYDFWKQSYVVDVGTNNTGKQMYRVNYNGDTVSEGQGYGMIITAIMAGYDPEAKEIFDGLWYFSRTMPSEINSNFMDWSLKTTFGNDSAFDGDADIAYALLIADKQWGSNSDINYKSEAVNIINALRTATISNKTYLPFLGDWVSQNDSHWSNISRPSDFMPANFRAFDEAVTNSDWEENVVNACLSKLQYIQNNFSSETGLVPDFIQNGDPAVTQVLESNNDGKYFYNACRVPMRIGVDALLSNSLISKAVAIKISNWAESSTAGNINNFYAGYELDGSPLANYTVTSFTAPLGVAAMCSGQQAWLNNIYSHIRTNRSYTYYEDSLNLICLLIITGNYWDSTTI